MIPVSVPVPDYQDAIDTLGAAVSRSYQRIRRATVDTTVAEVNVRRRTYNAQAIRDAIENFDQLPTDRERVFALAEATDRGLLDPDCAYAHNATSRDLHELVCHNLAPASGEARTVDSLLVGSSSQSPSHTDRSLVDPIGETDIAVAEVDANSLYVNTFVGTGEFNGNTIRELGLGAGPRLINRSLITATPKDPTKTITVEVILTLRDIAEVVPDGDGGGDV